MCIANTHPDADTNSNSHADPDTHSDTNANTYSDAHPVPTWCLRPNPDSNGNSNPYTNNSSNRDSYSYDSPLGRVNIAANPASVTTNTADISCSGSFQLSGDNFTTCVAMAAAPCGQRWKQNVHDYARRSVDSRDVSYPGNNQCNGRRRRCALCNFYFNWLCCGNTLTDTDAHKHSNAYAHTNKHTDSDTD